MIDISKITDYLYIGSQMGGEHLEEICILKMDLVISMIGHLKPPETFDQQPFKMLWLRTYDTFFTPISMAKLEAGVQAALPIVRKGGRVLVYCVEGKRRSVTMGASILIGMGYSAEEAMDMLATYRQVADPRRWYVQKTIKRFEGYWHKLIELNSTGKYV